MIIELITTGNELLDGRIVDTNASTIASFLFKHGLPVQRVTTVGDDKEILAQTFQSSINRADVMIVTGGLGPTSDDLTTEIIAKIAGVDLIKNEATVKKITTFFKTINRPMSKSNIKQAYIPKGAQIITNDRGTAPGIHIQINNCQVFAIPGVPYEMKAMLESYILPTLLKEVSSKPKEVTIIKTIGEGESRISDLLKPVLPLPSGISIGYQVKVPEVHIILIGDDKKLFSKVESQVKTLLGKAIYGINNDTFSECIGEKLRSKNKTLAIAESCTGGLISKIITETAGASDYFVLSAVTYSNQAKQDMLKIPSDIIEKYGAVSQEVAKAMAEGVRQVSGADIGLSVTGIAGPTGGTDEKPVGTVFIAQSTAKETIVNHHVMTGSRDRIQSLTAYTALNGLRFL